MKKILLLILIIFAANVCYSYSLNGFTTKFAEKFKTCSPYSEEVSFNANGAVYHDKKQIDGWFGDFCGYKQTIKTSNMTLYVCCAFTKSQVDTLYKALLIQPKYYGWDTTTQDIWDKYVLDKKNCQLSGKNIFGEGIKVDKRYLPYF